MGHWASAANGARRALGGVSPVEPELGLSPLPAAGQGFRGEERQLRSFSTQKSFPWCLLWGLSRERDILDLQKNNLTRAVPAGRIPARRFLGPYEHPCARSAATAALLIFCTFPGSVFFSGERIMEATSCLSFSQRALPSLHGEDKPRSAN